MFPGAVTKAGIPHVQLVVALEHVHEASPQPHSHSHTATHAHAKQNYVHPT